jgi:transcription antitermination factor NusG
MPTNTLDAPRADHVTDKGALSGARPSECGSHSGARWYVVQTHRGAERTAVIELANQDFAALLPLRRIDPKPADPSAPRRHRKRDELPTVAPAFPGYLFVLFDQAAQPWRAIHSTRGVKRLFSITPERPTPVPVGVVERLMARLAKDMVAKLPTEAGDPIPEGAIVTVLSGPFAGQEGVCIHGNGRHVRLRMLASGWDLEMPRFEVDLVG